MIVAAYGSLRRRCELASQVEPPFLPFIGKAPPSVPHNRKMTAPIDPLVVAKELFPNQPPGFPLERFNLADIRLPADDDLGIKSDDEDADIGDVESETGFGSVIGEHCSD